MFYEKLREQRKKYGMSQEDLADRLNISRQAVSKWESGLSMPDLENVIKLSELFQVPIDYLLKDRLTDSDYSYYTKEREEDKRTLSKNKLIALAMFILSVLCLMTLLVIALAEPISYLDGDGRTYNGFFAYYHQYGDFKAVFFVSAFTFVSSLIYLIIPEPKWEKLFQKKI